MFKNYISFSIIGFILTTVLSLAGSIAAQMNAPNDTKLTEVERREANEIATQFTIRFAKTKDIAPLIKDHYWDDFIEREINEGLKSLKDPEEDKWIAPFISCQAQLLKEGNKKDLQEFYIASQNFSLSQMLFITGLNKNADLDAVIKKMFSPRLKGVFGKNPNLADLANPDESGKSKPISSLKEMRNAIDTLKRGTKLFNEENKIFIPETKLRNLCKAFQTGSLSYTTVEVTNEDYYGLPKGTRVITVVTPLMLALKLAEKDNKLKIFATIPYAE